MRRAVFALCGALLLAGPAAALGLAGGAELGFLSVPLLTPDPYSFAATAGLWGELRDVGGGPLSLSLWLDAAGFRPLDGSFGASLMYFGGLEAGYGFTLFRDPELRLRLRPLARFGWYLRSVTISSEEQWGFRPFLSSGVLLEYRDPGLDLGLSLLASVPLDNRPVVLLGFLQRIGMGRR